jgi:hypothetical protein
MAQGTNTLTYQTHFVSWEENEYNFTTFTRSVSERERTIQLPLLSASQFSNTKQELGPNKLESSFLASDSSHIICNMLAYWARSYAKIEFTALSLLHNLWMVPISKSITLHYVGMAFKGQTLNLTGPISQATKKNKCSQVFTTLSLLHNLWMVTIS